MLRILWTANRPNQSILNELKIKDRLSTIIKRCILRFFGHTIRQDRLEKLCCKTEKSSSKRKSPTQYIDIKTTNISLAQCVRIAENKDTWRAMRQFLIIHEITMLGSGNPMRNNIYKE